MHRRPAENGVLSSRRSVFALIFCACLSSLRGSSAEAFPGVDDKWNRYESPHFELFSHATDRDSRHMLRRLELLHAVFGEMIRTKEQRPNQVTIYYFSSEKTFLPYTPIAMRAKDRLAGFYHHGPDRSVIVVSPVWDDEGAQRLIFHEYIHHLSRVSGDDPALWYTEGIAEFFSTIDEDRKHLSLGLPIVQHVNHLRRTKLMPLGALFGIDHRSGSYNESERAGLFYAQSWALLHYWYCGKIGLTPEKKAARDRFLALVRSEGENGDAAKRELLFKEAMGMDYVETVAALAHYVRSGRYSWSKIPLPDIPAMSTYTVEPVKRTEIARRLAELDLRVNHSGRGKLAMLEASTEQSPDIRALEVLGTEALQEGDVATAKERWQQAVDLGTTNGGVIHELAALEGHLWFSRLDLTFELPEAAASSLRELLFRSIEHAPNQSQAYEILAWVEATVKKPSAKNVNLVQQHLPGMRQRARTLLALALVRTRIEDFATARLFLQQAEREAAGPPTAQWIEVLRANITNKEAALLGGP